MVGPAVPIGADERNFAKIDLFTRKLGIPTNLRLPDAGGHGPCHPVCRYGPVSRENYLTKIAKKLETDSPDNNSGIYLRKRGNGIYPIKTKIRNLKKILNLICQ